MKTRAITEGALMAAITVITALISYYIPIASVIAYFAISIPTIILYKRYGLATALIESIISSFLLILFLGPLNALFLSANIILPGLLIGYSYKKEKSGGVRIVYGYIAFMAAFIVEVSITQIITGVSFTDSFIQELDATMNSMVEVYKSAGITETGTGQDVLTTVDNLKEAFTMMFPSLILLAPAFISYAAIIIDDFFFRRLHLSYIPVESITQWKFSRSAKTLLAITTLGTIILDYAFKGNEALLIYPYTIETLVFILYIVMGFATIFWLFQYKFHSRLIFLRLATVILCLFFSGLLSVVMIIGVIDIFFNIRRFFNKQEMR